MRIVQVCQWYIPELGYQEYSLAETWMRIGHEVLTVAGTQMYPRGAYPAGQMVETRRKVPPGRREESGTDVWRLPSLELRVRSFLSRRLESVVIDFKPDTVLVHGVTSPNAVRMARLARKSRHPFRLVCDDHLIASNMQVGVAGKLFYSIFRRFVTSRLMRSVDMFAPISQETREILANYCGIPQEMTTVVPLGVNLSRFQRNESNRQAVREELDIKPDEVLLVYAGKLNPSKQTATLIDATLSVLGKYPDVRLLVIGSGEPGYVDEQKRRVQEADLGNRVDWLPLQPNADLPRYFSAADIGIWPGTESMAVLEAAASELPIVCMSSPYHRERFGDSAALLFDGFDDMARQIERLVSDPELRRSTGKLARTAMEEIGWDRVAARYLEA